MRRALATLAFLLAFGCGASASAAGVEGWHSEQPIVAGAEVPVPLGQVGDIEFWAPNRGVLISAGVGAIPAGIYAYDGVGWHLYSSVCGGHEGRIAWAGPDEFWTISDQAPGQENVPGETQASQLWNRSLCHFKDGRVLASYAEPLGREDSYPHLDAAACSGPDDCWFGGERLSGVVNVGAFHLHWDGQTLSATPSLTSPEAELGDPGRTVEGLAFDGNRLYESVRVQEEDGEVPGEPDPAQPSFIHAVDPTAAQPFAPLFPEQPLSYGAGAIGTDLGPFRFAAAGEGLWAFAGARTAAATPTLLRFGPSAFAQVPLAPNSTFSPGDRVAAVAAEPGGGRFWVSFRHSAGEGAQPLAARIAAVGLDGGVGAPLLLPAAGELGHKGAAGPIACPGAGQCWMATEKGWLFHLGGSLPQDTDPAMRGPIGFRPPDDSTPSLPPVELPEDDSGAEPATPPPSEPEEDLPPRRRKARRLVGKVHQTVLGGTLLQLSFTLHARAHVHLVAKRGAKIVAQTARLTLASGPHRLRLRLDPKRWPTSLDFQVHPAGGRARR